MCAVLQQQIRNQTIWITSPNCTCRRKRMQMVTCVLHHGTCHCCKARVLNGSTGPFSTGADSGNNSDQSKLGWEPVPLLLPDPRRPASDLCSPFDFLISLAVSLFFFFPLFLLLCLRNIWGCHLLQNSCNSETKNVSQKQYHNLHQQISYISE